MDKIQILGDRLNRIGISVMFAANIPWVYLVSVNGVRVTETTPDSNHGFNIGWYPVSSQGGDFYFSNEREMFKIIRKYVEECT